MRGQSPTPSPASLSTPPTSSLCPAQGQPGLVRITFLPDLRLWFQGLALQLSILRPLVSNSANRSNFSTVGFTPLPLRQGWGLTRLPRQQFQCGDPPTTTQAAVLILRVLGVIRVAYETLPPPTTWTPWPT